MRRTSPYHELLAILCVVWLALAFYGLVEGHIWIGGEPVAKADLARYVGLEPRSPVLPDEVALSVTPDAYDSDERQVGDGALRSPASSPGVVVAAHESRPGEAWSETSAALPRASESVAEAAAPAEERVLIFGDSMVQSFLPLLNDYCLENGHVLHWAVAFGSTTHFWATDPMLVRELEAFRPTIAVAVIGAFEAEIRNAESREPYVKRILERIGERRFLWVGHASFRPDTGINALLARIIGPGRYFRSAPIAQALLHDGLHPKAGPARAWAQSFIDWWRDASDYPIALATPRRRAPRIVGLLVPQD